MRLPPNGTTQPQFAHQLIKTTPSNMPSHQSTSANNMKVAVVGGSLGGLAAANVFHRLGAAVTVFEKSPTAFGDRGACLGFVDVKMLQSFCGGKQFTRNGCQASLSQGAFFYGDVWKFLFDGLPSNTVKFGCQVDTLGEDAENPTIDGELFDLAIIADGGWSTLRGQYFDSEKPEYTGHQIYWASVDTEELPGGLGSFDCQFGSTEDATYSSGIYDAVILEAPKCNGSKMYACGFFIATPESEIKQPERGENRQLSSVRHDTKPDWFLPFIQHFFGKHANGEIVSFTEAAAAKGKIAPSPIFEYAADKTVAGRTVVLGDAAHLSTPWTAAGAYTAMLDAVALREVFGSRAFQSGRGDIDSALQNYDKGGIERAQNLLRQSRACSRGLIPRQGKHAIPSPASLVPKHAVKTKLEKVIPAV